MFMYVHVLVRAHRPCSHVEVRGQFLGVKFFLSTLLIQICFCLVSSVTQISWAIAFRAILLPLLPFLYRNGKIAIACHIWLLNFIYFLHLPLCWRRAGAWLYHSVHVAGLRTTWRVSLLFFYMGSREWLYAVRLGNKYLSQGALMLPY